jgi:hypothetical protein
MNIICVCSTLRDTCDFRIVIETLNISYGPRFIIIIIHNYLKMVLIAFSDIVDNYYRTNINILHV